MVHIPVLLNEVMTFIQETSRPIRYVLDGTFGRGGHTKAILKAFPEANVVALDQDEEAIRFGQKHLEGQNVHFFHGNFSGFNELKKSFQKIMGEELFDVILLDLGVSSPQLDEAERGFSFYHEGPLDMRMNQRSSFCAADIVNEWNEQELRDLFFHLGEIRRPGRVVRAILNQRKESPFQTTKDLSQLIEGIEGWSKKGRHPATQYFLALRLQVNQELEILEKAIPELIHGLAQGGRLLIISFHSLEDRIVKNIFKQNKEGKRVNKKVIQSQWEEKKKNPRARSAKLRVFQRGNNEKTDSQGI